MFPTPFQLTTPQHRKTRSFTQDNKPFLNNIIFQYPNPLPFEVEAHSIPTIPLVRECLGSYLYYIKHKTLDINASQNPFQIVFNAVQNINIGTYYRAIYPQCIPIPLKEVFDTYLNKLIEHNENLGYPIYRPSYLEKLERLRENSDYFEVQNFETKIKRQDNPHFWLQQDTLQITNSSTDFSKNIILNEDIVP